VRYVEPRAATCRVAATLTADGHQHSQTDEVDLSGSVSLVSSGILNSLRRISDPRRPRDGRMRAGDRGHPAT